MGFRKKFSKKKNSRRSRASSRSIDAVDPRDFFGSTAHKELHKAQQLCAQASRVIDAILGESGDELLSNLYVSSVEPAPDSSRLLVNVAYFEPQQATHPDIVHKRLEQRKGYFREELAYSIHRKRVPKLCFRVMWGQTR